MPGNCLTYTLRQLPARDEIVFKSVVNVLQGKTRHHWQHIADSDADLVVLGTQGDTLSVPVVPGHAVIQVFTDHGDHSGHGPQALNLPLRIADVIDCLDRAGDEVLRQAQRSVAPGSQPGAAATAAPRPAMAPPQMMQAVQPGPAAQVAPAAAAPAASVSQAPPAPQMSQSAATPAPRRAEPAFVPTPAALPTRASVPQAAPGGWHRVSLLRWPDPALLQEDLRFIKLATVMTGHPLTLVELAARTQFPSELCHRFVTALQDRGLLRVTGDLPPAVTVRPVSQTAPQGLLARIRARLEMIVRAPATK